jgi:deoxyribonuclease-1
MLETLIDYSKGCLTAALCLVAFAALVSGVGCLIFGRSTRGVGDGSVAPNTRIESFRSAKRHMMEIYGDHRRTLYCNCPFDAGKNVDVDACAYRPEEGDDSRRTRRVEWEHVVPAAALGRHLPAWKKGHPECRTRSGKRYRGRRCARKVSERFARMEADMHNLVPAVGAVNADRRAYAMGIVDGEPRAYGSCDIEIVDRTVEPAERVRGDVARTYLYMDRAYPEVELLDDRRREMFRAWSEADPVDDWERTRERRIADVQGNHNPFVREP